jgi:hypothetical protein
MKDERVPQFESYFSYSSLILPPSSLHCGVAKLVRHRTVNAAMRRFESFRHSHLLVSSPESQVKCDHLLLDLRL